MARGHRRYAKFHESIDEHSDEFPLHNATAILVGGRWRSVLPGTLLRYPGGDEALIGYRYTDGEEYVDNDDRPVVIVSAEAVGGFQW